MALIDAENGLDTLHPSEGWGDVPIEDRPLWSRYMVDHSPWFPGVTMMLHIAPRVLHGGTGAPRRWKEAAKSLHAAGFTPSEYYLLAEVLMTSVDELDPEKHGELFEVWPRQKVRIFLTFRLSAERWKPWLEQVRAGESPQRALEWVLTDGKPEPLGTLHLSDGSVTIIQ